MVCPLKSVRVSRYSLRNNPEERSSHLFLGGSLKSFIDRQTSRGGINKKGIETGLWELQNVGLTWRILICAASCLGRRSAKPFRYQGYWFPPFRRTVIFPKTRNPRNTAVRTTNVINPPTIISGPTGTVGNWTGSHVASVACLWLKMVKVKS